MGGVGVQIIQWGEKSGEGLEWGDSHKANGDQCGGGPLGENQCGDRGYRTFQNWGVHNW